MPDEETLRREAEMAAIFERSDALQKEMGIRLDLVPQRIHKGRQGSQAKRADHKNSMKVAGSYMVNKKKKR